jgi:starch phosphorylase
MEVGRLAISVSRIKEDIENNLKRQYCRLADDATEDQIFQCVALSVRDLIMDRWLASAREMEEKKTKRLYYLSAEFLLGRSLVNNMINLGIFDHYKKALDEMGFDIARVEAEENDAGLGNGGLGRLAACFLDSLSTMNLPVIGSGIRYEFGLFRQRIVDGEQVEVPDDWVETGAVWEIERPESQLEVHFGGEVEEVWSEQGLQIIHKNYQTVYALPCDMPIIGYESKVPATLRLWSARAATEFDLHSFNKGDYVSAVQQRELAESISKVLYPEDDHIAGRMLRMKQFYFLSSATMQNMVREHKARHGDVRSLPEYAVIQINDTHASFAIPELLRILLDEEHLNWDEAFDITHRLFNYTNHTVMQEALEKWPEDLLRQLMPRVHTIIRALSDKFSERLWRQYPGDWDKISNMTIIAYNEVRMANLCIAVCSRVNGVSQLHGSILKTKTFRDFYVMFPEKFMAVTNGITQRRWLAESNPGLTELLSDHIGRDFIGDYRDFERLEKHIENKQLLKDFMEVKQQNKERLAEHVRKRQRVELNPHSVFDVQAKRLHEYKRQLLKAMHILVLYHRFTTDPAYALPAPVTFLFAAKASPGYKRAKDIIRLINAISVLVNNDPRTKDKIQVVFLENYDVSLAQLLMPATDISEQISTAGREASGTGNMKFMMNGALTLGTMDGANVEIYEQVGKKNIFIFGATAQEISRLEAENTYNPKLYADKNAELAAALARLIDGSLGGNKFEDLHHSLLYGDYDRADKYFVLYDFESYDKTFAEILAAYADKPQWVRMAAINTARSGFFSSDRTIGEYNRLIWQLTALK